MIKERFDRLWLVRKARYLWYSPDKLNMPGFDNMRWTKGQWEIIYRIASFEFRIARDYHEPDCTCDRSACEERRKYG